MHVSRLFVPFRFLSGVSGKLSCQGVENTPYYYGNQPDSVESSFRLRLDLLSVGIGGSDITAALTPGRGNWGPGVGPGLLLKYSNCNACKQNNGPWTLMFWLMVAVDMVNKISHPSYKL